MAKETQSKCQICGGMCVETVEKAPKNAPKDMIHGDGMMASWGHVSSKNSWHPPFPALEHTKKEALEQFRDWQREFKQKGDEEMFLTKLQEQNRIVIPQAVAEVLKVKKGDKIRITAEKVD